MLKLFLPALFLSLTLLQAAIEELPVPKPISIQDEIQLSAGRFHTCAIDEKGVQCWGDNDKGQLNVPGLLNPRQVSAGAEHTCALDDEGVKCWGLNDRGQTQVPRLLNPRVISSGGRHNCAIDDSGVKCWGWNRDGQINVPPLRNPKMVSAGGHHTCAIDDNGLTCWGFSGDVSIPLLRHPRDVSAGEWHTCALDDDGLKCWGWYMHTPVRLPELLNPRQISSKGNYTCALDDHGVQCWGVGTYGHNPVPTLFDPKQISTGWYHACAEDAEGIKCWDNKEGVSKQTSVPTGIGLSVSFKLSKLEKSLQKLSRYVYRYKERFFKGIASDLEHATDHTALSRYVFLELIGSVIETTHSEMVETKVFPFYKRYLEQVRSEMRLNSFDDVELTAEVFKAVLSSSIHALKSSKEYLLVEEEAKEQEQMLSQLGALTSLNQAKEMLAVLNSHRTLIDSMTQNPRLDGFGLLLEKVRIFLERKMR